MRSPAALLESACDVQGGSGPPPNCRVGRSLIQGSKWVPIGFFRLFCTCRTCSPKPESAPFLNSVGSKHNFQSRAWQGYSPQIVSRGLFRPPRHQKRPAVYHSPVINTFTTICFALKSQPACQGHSTNAQSVD